MNQLLFRISRLISVITFITCGAFVLIYLLGVGYNFVIFENRLQEIERFTDFFLADFGIYILSLPILLVFNWLSFGKLTVWIKK